MTHGYNRFIKSDSSTRDEQNIFSKKETQMMTRENKKMSTHDNLRRSSQNLLKKLRKITLSSTSSNQNEQKSNHPPEKILSDTSESNAEFKLKGILKNVPCSNSCNNIQANESHIEICQKINTKENSNDLISSDSVYNHLYSLKPVKHVTFNEKICKKRYKPMELSHPQQNKSENRERRDSLTIYSTDLTDGYSSDLSKFQEFHFYESSEDESIDDNNND